jgi:hypothetical protein
MFSPSVFPRVTTAHSGSPKAAHKPFGVRKALLRERVPRQIYNAAREKKPVRAQKSSSPKKVYESCTLLHFIVLPFSNSFCFLQDGSCRLKSPLPWAPHLPPPSSSMQPAMKVRVAKRGIPYGSTWTLSPALTSTTSKPLALSTPRYSPETLMLPLSPDPCSYSAAI